MHDVEPQTPDFYRYPWEPISAVTLDGPFVELRWADGVHLRAFQLWLAENTMGRTIDRATRECVLDPADLTDDTTIASAELTPDGALMVTWCPDGHQARYHPGWLRHVADAGHLASAGLPAQQPWTAELARPPTGDGSNLLGDGNVLDRWLGDLARFGLARLTDVGTDPDLLLAVGARIGAIRDTNFGPIWSVRADPEPTTTANTTYPLCPHTDLPTRETPPGFQFLHCIANSTRGGWSTMADGLTVVAHLRAEHPDHYEALTTLRWIFFNRGETVDHRWSGPIIDLGVDGSPLTIRAFHPVRAFPDMDETDQPAAYAALRCFATLAADPRFQIRYPFSPGDLVGFDNRRILHGRDGFEVDGPSGGHRHLRGIYIDHDEIHSHLRVASRRSRTAT